jgi:hypothetical protein
LVKIIAVAAISCEACQLQAPAPLRAMNGALGIDPPKGFTP